MGCDISILSQHNLNITDVKTLAIDLSNRLGFSIEYGYYNIEIFSTLLEKDLKEDFISLGTIDKEPQLCEVSRLRSKKYLTETDKLMKEIDKIEL